MRRALVIGASGQIGQSLIPQLLERGDCVFALSRRDRTSRSANLEWIRGELFAAMPEIPEVDVIFSLGPLNGFAAAAGCDACNTSEILSNEQKLEFHSQNSLWRSLAHHTPRHSGACA